MSRCGLQVCARYAPAFEIQFSALSGRLKALRQPQDDVALVSGIVTAPNVALPQRPLGRIPPFG
jgi:hypothetical protein